MLKPEWLQDTTTYPERKVPDGDLLTCLKVLRTLRGVCTAEATFRPRAAVILSHAHYEIVQLAETLKEQADHANDQQTETTPPPSCSQQPQQQGNGEPYGYDPDLAV